MRVAVISQEDRFTLPRVLEEILAVDGVQVVLVAVVRNDRSLASRKKAFARGFGLVQGARMAAVLGWAALLDALDRATGWRLLRRKRSLRGVAGRHDLPFSRIGSPNSRRFLDRLRSLEVDLVVSLSAPSLFKARLLALPRFGCVNLHGSLLPRYAGLLPSFWMLFHGERTAGATVHLMNARIDQGAILAQAEVPVRPSDTQFELVRRTKAAGTELLVGVLSRLARGETMETLPNRPEEGSYFSWPTLQEMRDFRRRGGRFI